MKPPLARRTGSLTLAREFRKHMTPTEDILWQAIRNQRCGGLKFRRQVPLGPFIVDFLCREQRLIIEVDGTVHNTDEQKQYDEQRTRFLNDKGYRVIRFSNQQVLDALPLVLQAIQRQKFTTEIPLSHTLRVFKKLSPDQKNP